MSNLKSTGILILAITCLMTNDLYAQPGLDLESGLAMTGYNDVRIPGNTGTLFSLSNELKADNTLFYRVRLNYSLNPKNTISILFAPLTIKSAGRFGEVVNFENVNFPANTEVNATYKFNSYRLTYRYEIYQGRSFEFGLGLTGKIRDASIRLRSGTIESFKDNIGFVPLINFRFFLPIHDRLGFLFLGDALAAPQGRAEDVLAALTYAISDKLSVKAGYRLLEGGAKNDAVYTFALINYVAFGLMVHL